MAVDSPAPRDTVPDPLADLPPTARRIVEITRRLLIEKGYSYLSLENIAEECGLHKTAVRYYFRNKAGLMELVVDSWVHDNIGLLAPLLDLPPAEGLLSLANAPPYPNSCARGWSKLLIPGVKTLGDGICSVSDKREWLARHRSG